MTTSVYLVEDDEDIGQMVRRHLERSGEFAVSVFTSGEAFLAACEDSVPDLAVLDLSLPDTDGLTLCRELRTWDTTRTLPILMLTARAGESDRVMGLELGADDYLTKPFDLGELVARLHALLRRAHHSDRPSDTMTVGPLTIDTARRLVFVDGERVDLTKREFDLLAVLAEHKTAVLSRAQLLELVWGYDFAADTNVVDVFIGYLRRKLEAGGAPRLLHTVRGVGFVLRQQ